jgi:hypothetical protein
MLFSTLPCGTLTGTATTGEILGLVAILGSGVQPRRMLAAIKRAP